MTATRDYSRQGRRNRRVGAEGEREVVALLREYGYLMAHRQFQSGGAGGGDVADAIPNVHLEVKRTATTPFAAWFNQAHAAARPTDLVLVVHRGHGQPWQATGLLTDLHGMLDGTADDPEIASSNVRARFMASLRGSSGLAHPMVLHTVRREVMATVLFEDFLRHERMLDQ